MKHFKSFLILTVGFVLFFNSLIFALCPELTPYDCEDWCCPAATSCLRQIARGLCVPSTPQPTTTSSITNSSTSSSSTVSPTTTSSIFELCPRRTPYDCGDWCCRNIADCVKQRLGEEVCVPSTPQPTTTSSITNSSTSSSSTTTPNTTTTITSSTTTTECFFSQIYGEESVEVELLRQYRDQVLSETPTGKEIIELYHKLSPVILQAIEEDEEFKEEVKELIDERLPMIEEVVE